MSSKRRAAVVKKMAKKGVVIREPKRIIVPPTLRKINDSWVPETLLEADNTNNISSTVSEIIPIASITSDFMFVDSHYLEMIGTEQSLQEYERAKHVFTTLRSESQQMWIVTRRDDRCDLRCNYRLAIDIIRGPIWVKHPDESPGLEYVQGWFYFPDVTSVMRMPFGSTITVNANKYPEIRFEEDLVANLSTDANSPSIMPQDHYAQTFPLLRRIFEAEFRITTVRLAAHCRNARKAKQRLQKS